MHCIVRSADRVAFDGEADRIVARSPDGEFAVLDGHAPFLAALTRGVIRILTGEIEYMVACHGGAIEVEPDRATLLVERPYPLEEIDPEALRAALSQQETGEVTVLSEEQEYLQFLIRVKEQHA
jgi:F-type H+-transporting ATPase subunit epsilon